MRDDRIKTSRKRVMPLGWLCALVIVFSGLAASWIVEPVSFSTADGTGGTAGTGGTGETDGNITVYFTDPTDSTDSQIEILFLSDDGPKEQLSIKAHGLIPGSHDTVQLLVRHDPLLVEISSVECAGLFNDAHTPNSPIQVGSGDVAFVCGLTDPVTEPSGIIANLSLERIAPGSNVLELITNGEFGTRFFSAGVPTNTQTPLSLNVVDPAPTPTPIPPVDPSPASTVEPTPIATTPTVSPSPVNTATVSPTVNTPTVSPSPTGTIEATAVATTPAVSPEPTGTVTVTQTVSPEPAATVGVTSTASPEPSPSPSPTVAPTSNSGGGGGGFTPPQSTPTPSISVPGIPRELEVNAGDGQVELTWLPPQSNGGAVITGYVVRSADGTINQSTDGQPQPVIINELENGREYRFRVQAVNILGAGSFTDPSAPVTPVGPPSAPVQANAEATQSTDEIVVNWSPPEQLNGAKVETYTIKESTGLYPPVTVPAGVLSYTFESAPAGEYVFMISATNSSGAGPSISASVTVTGDTDIPGQGAPGEPTPLPATSESSATAIPSTAVPTGTLETSTSTPAFRATPVPTEAEGTGVATGPGNSGVPGEPSPAPTPTIDADNLHLPVDPFSPEEDVSSTSLVAFIAIGTVIGVTGLGVIGYFVTHRGGVSLSALLAPVAAAGVVLTIVIAASDGVSQRASAAGSVTSEGDTVLHSQELRDEFGVDGSGVSIGIISDSFGCDEAAIGADISDGDLPVNITVLADVPPHYCDFTSDRGRAIAQVIHDVAPGADITFRWAGIGGRAQAAVSVHSLVNSGVDIIVSDMLFSDELHFQDDVLAQTVDTVTADGIIYFAAAGDRQRSSYESEFVDGEMVGTECNSITPSICTNAGMHHDFDSGPGIDRFLDISLSLPAERTTISLTWEQPGDSSGGDGVTSEVDLIVYDSTGSLLAVSKVDNLLSGTPIEIAPVSGQSAIQVAVSHRSGPHPGKIRLVATDGAFINEHQGDAGAIVGQANAKGAITVGSVHHLDWSSETPIVDENSSTGGVGISFAIDGTPLDPPDVRQKPDFVAPSGVATTFEDSFDGTSAAAAHAAGVAALLLERDPDLRDSGEFGPEQMRWLLTRSAVDIGTEGPDFVSGYGLLDAMAAVELLDAGPPVTIVDEFTVDMNGELSLPTPGLLENDTDLSGQPLESILELGPTNGMLSLAADGSFTYKPTLGFLGEDTFSYRVTNGGFTGEAESVTITVLPIESLRARLTLQGATNGADFGAEEVVLLIQGEGVTESIVGDPSGSGEFLFEGLKPGTYSLTASMPGFLDAVHTDVTLGIIPGATVTVPHLTLLGGDSNGNGIVDIADVNIMLESFGSRFAAGDLRNSDGHVADLNGDGVTNGADLSITLANLDLTSPVPWGE